MINGKQIEQIKQQRSLSSFSLKRRKSTISTVNHHLHHYNENDVVFNKEVQVVDAVRRLSNFKLIKDHQMNQNAKGRRSLSEALQQKNNIQKSSNPYILSIPKDKRTSNFLPNLGQKIKTTLSINDLSKPKTLKLSSSKINQQQLTMKQQLPSAFNIQTNKPFKSPIQLQRLYSKTSTDYNKQQKLWDYHLKQQLSLQEAIEQLQKIELDRNLHPSRKLTMRQAYQLKKEIVSEIQKEQSAELIRGNIERLSEIALDEKERDKCLTIGLFVTLRQKLRSPPNSPSQFTFSASVITQLKQHLPQCPSRHAQQPNIITTKILSILSLHIMKLQSPRFSPQDVKLINQAIQMKIKAHAVFEYLPDEKQYSHLQAVIYMIYQFYKILFYLRLNEQIKTHQYTLLQAYITLYRESNPLKYGLFEQNYCIAKTIAIIKPITADIHPYQDTRGRNEANHAMLKYQIHHKDKLTEDNSTIGRTKRLEHNNMRGSAYSRAQGNDQQVSDDQSSSLQSYYHETAQQQRQPKKQIRIENHTLTTTDKLSTKPITTNRKSILKNNQKLQIAKQLIGKATAKVLRLTLARRYSVIYSNEDHHEQQRNLDNEQLENAINIKKFSFPFLLMKLEQIYHGQFIVTLSQTQPKTVNLHIRVTDPNGFYLTFFNCNDIRTFSEQLTKQNFQKIIWKIFKRIFVTNYIQQQDPFLMKQPISDIQHMQNHFPKDCQELQDCQIIEILHAYIVYWLRMREFSYCFNGKILAKPEFQLSEVNKYMEYLEYERDRKLFQKRQGFLVPSSGHRASLMHTKDNSHHKPLYFNPILKDFVTITTPSDPYQQQLNIFSLTKLIQFQKSQFNFLHLVFHDYLRQLNIFQFGVYKHQLTSTLNNNIKLVRKMSICHRHSKQKLIQCIQRKLAYNINTGNNNKRIGKQSHEVDDIAPYQKYRIKQEFEIDLTNQFNIIPSVNMRLMLELRADDQQGLESQRGEVEVGRNKGFGNGRRKRRRCKQTTKPASFKVENQVFLTFAQQYPWGRKLSSLTQCLQFFQLHNTPRHLSYSLHSISVYRIGLVTDQRVHQFVTEDGRQYNYYNVNKPFLSKAQTQAHTQGGEDRFGQEQGDGFENSNVQVKTHENPIHFLQSRIFFTLMYQKILKFKINNITKYFSFQTYQSIQEQDIYSLSQEKSKPQQPLFIYQLTNLQQPHIKSYLLTTKTITYTDSQHIGQLINLKQNTLMGDSMQLFTLPINRVTFTNEFNQSRTKNVRKKVVSEANQFFQQKVLQADSKVGRQTLMLNILQRYHGKPGVGNKVNYEIDDDNEFREQHQEQQSQKEFGLQ